MKVTLGNDHKGCPNFLRFLEIPTYTYVLYSMYYLSYSMQYLVQFSLTYLPTQKSDILYGRSLTAVKSFVTLSDNPVAFVELSEKLEFSTFSQFLFTLTSLYKMYYVVLPLFSFLLSSE